MTIEQDNYHLCIGCRQWVCEDHVECMAMVGIPQSYTSADFDNDYAKERQFMELGAEQMLKPAPHRAQFERETDKEEILAGIERENANGTQQGRG